MNKNKEEIPAWPECLSIDTLREQYLEQRDKRLKELSNLDFAREMANALFFCMFFYCRFGSPSEGDAIVGKLTDGTIVGFRFQAPSRMYITFFASEDNFHSDMKLKEEDNAIFTQF